MKKITLFFVVLMALSFASCSPEEEQKDYGVFLGKEEVEDLQGYRLVVVDADYLDTETIEKLHENNNQVYTYLNIGTLENFRGCYDDFRSFAFDVYEDWPEEYWMDVSLKSWQDHIQKKAVEYQEMGVDGFFIDNTDVYAEYPTDEIYRGLVEIMEELNSLNLPIIVNGGDVFVKRAIESQELDIDGVNQETIFSSIDFENRTLGKSDKEHREYYQEYVNFCKENDLSVFLLEYTRDEKVKREIKEYCHEKGYRYYISPSLELTGD